jgi:hypothetical protein
LPDVLARPIDDDDDARQVEDRLDGTSVWAEHVNRQMTKCSSRHRLPRGS